jgi:hypothetical protein
MDVCYRYYGCRLSTRGLFARVYHGSTIGDPERTQAFPSKSIQTLWAVDADLAKGIREAVTLDIYDNDTRTLRRPRLTDVHHLTSLHQLQPFCARASIDTFEGVYGNQGVDWETVEAGLDREVFESRE